MIYISVIDLRTLFFCYAQGPGPFADYRHGTVTPSLAAYIFFLAAKAELLLSSESMEGVAKAMSLIPRERLTCYYKGRTGLTGLKGIAPITHLGVSLDSIDYALDVP